MWFILIYAALTIQAWRRVNVEQTPRADKKKLQAYTQQRLAMAAGWSWRAAQHLGSIVRQLWLRLSSRHFGRKHLPSVLLSVILGRCSARQPLAGLQRFSWCITRACSGAFISPADSRPVSQSVGETHEKPVVYRWQIKTQQRAISYNATDTQMTLMSKILFFFFCVLPVFS